MSQQPCLPVPPRKKRKRRQQQQQQQDGNHHEGDDDDTAPSDVQFEDIQTMSASEYLGRVVEQARHIPSIMVNNETKTSSAVVQGASHHRCHDEESPIQGSAASLHYLVSHRTALVPPPSSSFETNTDTGRREWVDGVLDAFSRLRDSLETYRLAGVGGKEHRQHKSLPRLRDADGWHDFCLGKQSQAEEQHYGEEYDKDNGKEEREIPEWEQNLPTAGYPPTTILLLQMDQVMVRRVLGHLVQCYVNNKGYEAEPQQQQQHHRWLYALLARLDRPLHRDDAAVLYSLLKQLSVDRAANAVKAVAQQKSGDDPTTLDTDKSATASTSNNHADDALGRLNLLMVIVGLYFEQGGGYEAIMGSPSSSSL